MVFHTVDKILVMSSGKWNSHCLPAAQPCHWPWEWGGSRSCRPGTSASRAGREKAKKFSPSPSTPNCPMQHPVWLNKNKRILLFQRVTQKRSESDMFLPLPYCRWFKDHISLCPSIPIHVQVLVELPSKAATEATQPEEMLRKQKKEWLSTKHLYPLHCLMELLE